MCRGSSRSRRCSSRSLGWGGRVGLDRRRLLRGKSRSRCITAERDRCMSSLCCAAVPRLRMCRHRCWGLSWSRSGDLSLSLSLSRSSGHWRRSCRSLCRRRGRRRVSRTRRNLITAIRTLVHPPRISLAIRAAIFVLAAAPSATGPSGVERRMGGRSIWRVHVRVVRSRRIGHLRHCMHTHRPRVTHLGSILCVHSNKSRKRGMSEEVKFQHKGGGGRGGLTGYTG